MASKPQKKPAAAATSVPSVQAQAQVGGKRGVDYDEITYVPEEGDPVRTRWNGFEFKAFVPRQIPRSMTVQVPIKKETEMPDGTVQSRNLEQRVPMYKLAEGNCRFMVNGKSPLSRVTDLERIPESPEQYRGYALEWMAGSTQASAMDARWKSEEELRDKIGVGDDDIRYLRPFFEARFAALGGGGAKPQREIRMGLTRAELELDARAEG